MTAATAERPPGARALERWLGPLVALLLVLAPVVFWGGRLVDEEAIGFLQKNWGERGALQKIFDVRGWDYYQGRELSYAIDYADGLWVRQFLARGIVFFVPPSALVASLGFVWIGLRLVPRAVPALDAATRWLCLLLLLSNFVFVTTMGLLYRATKPLVAPMVLALFLLALAEQRDPRLGRAAAFAASFLLSLGMSLLDRQGLFYVLSLLLVLAALCVRSRRTLPLALGAAGSVACWYLYFAVLGPRLIHALEGYWPSLRFQRLRPGRLLDVELWRQAAGILGDWTCVLFGSVAPLSLAAAATAAALAWAWRERRRPGLVALATGMGAAAVLAQLTMVAMMLERHPPVAWVSHRLWYYPFPYQAVLVFALLWLLDLAARGRAGRLPAAVPVALAALVVLNVARWPEKRAEIASEPAFDEKLRRSDLLARSLATGRAEPLLEGDHRRFYFDCLDAFPGLAAQALSQVGEGGGVRMSELEGNRVVAWAEQQAHLVVRTAQPGRFVMAGRARLRGGETLQVLLGSPPRLVAEVARPPQADGDEAFRVVLDLPAGVNDVLLLSRLPELHVPRAAPGTTAGYQLLLPVALWPAPRAD